MINISKKAFFERYGTMPVRFKSLYKNVISFSSDDFDDGFITITADVADLKRVCIQGEEYFQVSAFKNLETFRGYQYEYLEEYGDRSWAVTNVCCYPDFDDN